MLVKAQAATPADLERAVGQVEVAAAEMHVINQKLEQTRVRSPINGTVMEVLVRSGESLAGEKHGILKIADLSALVAEVDVAEGELKNVYIGQQAELTTDSQRGRVYKGQVRDIAEQADRARGTVQVKLDILPEAAEPGGAGSAAGSAAAGSGAGMAVQVKFIPREPPPSPPT
jgi:multidrug resistance efflux pump